MVSVKFLVLVPGTPAVETNVQGGGGGGDFWINLMASVPSHCRRRDKKKTDGTAAGWQFRLFSWRNKGAADAGLILF